MVADYITAGHASAWSTPIRAPPRQPRLQILLHH